MLFWTEMIPDCGLPNRNLVKQGVLRAEKLVDMSKHRYRLAPNVRFKPDQKWAMFR